jgi:hypothetical protein
MVRKISFLVTFIVLMFKVNAQTDFITKCIGKWHGTMYIYASGKLRDSVKVELTIAKTDTPNLYTWKTEYKSEKMPMVKDYKMKLSDTKPNCFITDEGDGIELENYLFNDKLYNIFETEGIMLTSSYECVNENLVFEVTSGKKTENSNKDVINYSVLNLQRVVFSRNKN